MVIMLVGIHPPSLCRKEKNAFGVLDVDAFFYQPNISPIIRAKPLVSCSDPLALGMP